MSDPNEIWHVEVHRNGEKLLTIGHNSLCGKDPLSERELEVIRLAGKNLLGFAGRADSEPFIPE